MHMLLPLVGVFFDATGMTTRSLYTVCYDYLCQSAFRLDICVEEGGSFKHTKSSDFQHRATN